MIIAKRSYLLSELENKVSRLEYDLKIAKMNDFSAWDIECLQREIEEVEREIERLEYE